MLTLVFYLNNHNKESQAGDGRPDCSPAFILLVKNSTPQKMKIVKEEIGDVLTKLHESNITCDIQLLKGGVYWSVQHDNEEAEGNSADLLSAMTDISESVLRLYPETKFSEWYGEKKRLFGH